MHHKRGRAMPGGVAGKTQQAIKTYAASKGNNHNFSNVADHQVRLAARFIRRQRPLHLADRRDRHGSDGGSIAPGSPLRVESP